MKILLVDDSEVLRRTLRRILPRSIEVVEASNGLEGWHAIQACNGQFDLVISDMKMPVLDGKGLFLKVQETYPELARRVIFQTGGTEHMSWLMGQQQPVLTKPYCASDVFAALEKFKTRGSATA